MQPARLVPYSEEEIHHPGLFRNWWGAVLRPLRVGEILTPDCVFPDGDRWRWIPDVCVGTACRSRNVWHVPVLICKQAPRSLPGPAEIGPVATETSVPLPSHPRPVDPGTSARPSLVGLELALARARIKLLQEQLRLIRRWRGR